MKKIIAILLSLILVFTFTNSTYATASEKISNVKEIELNTFEMTDSSSIDFGSNEEIVVHNNGRSIGTNYLVKGQENGTYVVAIRYEKTSEGTIETVYYTNIESIEKSELDNIISSDIANTRVSSVSLSSNTRASSSPTIKRHQWSFYQGSSKMAVVTTTTEYYKESGNATFNNKNCSVWDVVTFTQYEKVNCFRLNEQYTRLSVESFSSEYLLSYGPVGNKSGGEVSVGLDGAGVPSFGYSFSIDGFSVKDLSSVSNKYGRWRFVDYVGNENSFTTQPGIRVANTSGSLVVELSHSVEYKNSSGTVISSSTGVVQDWITDR